MRILVTGGTVFVSRSVAAYFAARGHEVYVLNRGSRPQLPGVHHICGDRHDAELELSGYSFDALLDVTAYTAEDVADMYRMLPEVGCCIMVSSSAVYPETLPQPFREDMPLGANTHWGAYGTSKIAAEQQLLSCRPDSYILRPPYLYGPGNNVFREAFVFECAEADRPFYLPGDGSMPLQFFHVEDLCRLMDAILQERPVQHIFNTGNPVPVTVRDWVTMCYAAVGKTPRFIGVEPAVPQRSYFPFLNYAYHLDVPHQQALLPCVKDLQEGLQEAYEWFCAHREEVRRKPLMDFIDANLRACPPFVDVL